MDVTVLDDEPCISVDELRIDPEIQHENRPQRAQSCVETCARPGRRAGPQHPLILGLFAGVGPRVAIAAGIRIDHFGLGRPAGACGPGAGHPLSRQCCGNRDRERPERYPHPRSDARADACARSGRPHHRCRARAAQTLDLSGGGLSGGNFGSRAIRLSARPRPHWRDPRAARHEPRRAAFRDQRSTRACRQSARVGRGPAAAAAARRGKQRRARILRLDRRCGTGDDAACGRFRLHRPRQCRAEPGSPGRRHTLDRAIEMAAPELRRRFPADRAQRTGQWLRRHLPDRQSGVGPIIGQHGRRRRLEHDRARSAALAHARSRRAPRARTATSKPRRSA